MELASNRTAQRSNGTVVHPADFRAKANIGQNKPALNADDLSDFRYRLSAIRSVVDGLIERTDALKLPA